MASRAFYGSLQWIPFLKKIFHIKLTSNGRKRIVQKIYLLKLKREKKKKARSPPTGVERIYALPTAQQVRCVTHWATGDSLTRLENLIVKYVEQRYRCY